MVNCRAHDIALACYRFNIASPISGSGDYEAPKIHFIAWRRSRPMALRYACNFSRLYGEAVAGGVLSRFGWLFCGSRGQRPHYRFKDLELGADRLDRATDRAAARAGKAT